MLRRLVLALLVLIPAPPVGAQGGFPLYDVGQRKLEAGNPRGSLEDFKEALVTYTEPAVKARVLLGMAEAHDKLQEKSQALSSLDLVLRDGPEEFKSRAQFLKGWIEAKYLLAPDGFYQVLESFSRESPLTLDFDVLRHLVGYQKGYRLDEVGIALEHFHDTWKNHPEGSWAPHALLHQGLIEGFLLVKPGDAAGRFQTILDRYPASAPAPTARLALATLKLTLGEHEISVKMLEEVRQGKASVPARFLQGITLAYYMSDCDGALQKLRFLDDPAAGIYRTSGIFHQAFILFACKREPVLALQLLQTLRTSTPPTDLDPYLLEQITQLEAQVQRVIEAPAGEERALAYALFWYANHHYSRASVELTEITKRAPFTPSGKRASFLLGKIAQEDIEDEDTARRALFLGTGSDAVAGSELAWRQAKVADAETPEGVARLTAIYQDPESPFRHLAGVELAQAGALAETRDIDRIEAEIEKESSGDVRSRLYAKLGARSLEQAAPHRALELFRRAVLLSPAPMKDADRARKLVGINRLQKEIDREVEFQGVAPDPAKLMELGRLYVALDQEEEAMGAFGKAKRSKREDPAAQAAKEEARLEEILIRVKRSRFLNQALRYLEEYVAGLDEKSPRRLKALESRVELLEKSGDPTHAGELQKGYETLLEARVDPEIYRVKLARLLMSQEKDKAAIEVLGHTQFGDDRWMEVMKLRGELYDRLKEDEAALTAYREMARREPESSAGQEAGRQVASRLASRLEAVMTEVKDKGRFAHEVDRFLAGVDPVWAVAAQNTLEKLASPQYASELPPPVLARLIEVAEAAKIDARIRARLYSLAAKRVGPEEQGKLALSEARALVEAGDTQQAVAILSGGIGGAPEGRLLLARTYVRHFKDDVAARRELEALLARDDVPPNVLADAHLEYCDLIERAGSSNGATALSVLDQGLQRLGASELALPLVEAKAVRLRGAGKLQESGQLLLASVADASDPAVRRELTLAAAKDLTDAGLYQEAAAAIRQLEGSGKNVSLDMELRKALQRSEALLSVDRMTKALNWDDPEAFSNLEILVALARLNVSPLKRYDETYRHLAQVEALFGDEGKRQAAEIRKEAETRASLKPLEEKAEKSPADYLELAHALEVKAGDERTSATYLEELLQLYPRSSEALLGAFRLIRVYAVLLDDKERAQEILTFVKARKDLDSFGPELEVSENLIKNQDRWSILELQTQNAFRDKHDEAALASISEMAKLAVNEFRDTALASRLVDRLAAAARQRSNAQLGLEAYRLAAVAAFDLPAGKSTLTAMPGRAHLAKRALELAPDAVERSRVWNRLAEEHDLDHRPKEALEAYQKSLTEARGTPWEKESLYRVASLQESMENLEGARQAYGDLARLGGKDAYQEVAERRGPMMEKHLRSRDREQTLETAPGGANYYRVAREQKYQDEDFQRSLENFLTFLRVGRDRDQLVDSYLESADILMRLDRPKEAVEMVDKMLARFPEHPRRGEALYRQGRIFESGMANYLRARDRYKEVVDLDPDSEWAKEAEVGLKRVRESLADLDRALDQSAGPEAIQEDLSAIREKYIKELGSYEQAVAAIESQLDATTSAEDRATLYRELGIIHEEELKNFPEAVQAYGHFIEETEDVLEEGRIVMRIARIYAEKVNEPDKALEYLDQFQSKYYNHPEKIDAMLYLAELKETKLDDTQGAINIYRNIANSFPRSGYDEKALLKIADISRRQFADYNSAIEALRRVVRDFPFSDNAPYAQLTIATLFEVELGDLENAALEYQRLIEAYPLSSYADGARSALIRLKARR